MTIETRSTIELGDVVAIEYECAACHSKTIRVLNDKHNIPTRCGNCPANWFADGSGEQQDLSLLVNVLRDFPKSSISRHVTVKLEIKKLASALISAHASDATD